MKSPSLSADIWLAIYDDWVSCEDTVTAIAARHGIARGTLSKRAKSEGWPPRGSNRSVALARQLYADITAELRASLQSLQTDGADEATATASQRGPLIRAHRRALMALLDASKPMTPKGRSSKTPTKTADPQEPGFPALDLDTARREILDRLSRLDHAPPADLKPPPADAPAPDLA